MSEGCPGRSWAGPSTEGLAHHAGSCPPICRNVCGLSPRAEGVRAVLAGLVSQHQREAAEELFKEDVGTIQQRPGQARDHVTHDGSADGARVGCAVTGAPSGESSWTPQPPLG